MKALLLMALLQQDEPSIREKVQALAKDPKANREAILKLGPAALRPLLDARTDVLEPVIFDLKFAGATEAGAAAKKKLASMKLDFDFQRAHPDDLLAFLCDFTGLDVVIDPRIAPDCSALAITLAVKGATGDEALRAIGGRLGLEYGWVRGHIVYSTPSRLWTAPPEKARKLTEADVKELRADIAALGDDSLDVRDGAAKAIFALGEAALPELEAAGTGDAEARARVKDLIAKVRVRAEPPVFMEKLALERQELGEAEKKLAKELASRTISMKVNNLMLAMTLKLLLSQIDGNCVVASAVPATKVTLSFDSVPLLELLYFYTAPFGLDAYLLEGHVVVDTRENVEKALRK